MSRRRRYKNNDNFIILFYVLFWWLILPIYLIKFLLKISKINKTVNKNTIYNDLPSTEKVYNKKTLVTECEQYFLHIIDNHFGSDYRIVPQVPLSSIVNKDKLFDRQYQGELYRTIDIGIFDKETFEPLLMIEINDKTHAQADRYERDLKVREILKTADIPLLTFYTGMSNKEDYIVQRIADNL